MESDSKIWLTNGNGAVSGDYAYDEADSTFSFTSHDGCLKITSQTYASSLEPGSAVWANGETTDLECTIP